MLKKYLLGVALLMTLGLANAAVYEVYDYQYVSANSGLTVLQFESGSTGFSTPSDIVISPYGSTTAAGWHGQGTLNYFAANGIPSEKFGEQFLGNVSSLVHSDVWADFQGATNFVGAWLMWAGDLETIKTIDFSVYGAGNQLLFSKALAAPQFFDQIYFYGIWSDQAIARVVWHPVEDSFFRLDNMSYGIAATPVAVPEPETYAMLLAGLSLLGAVARRRKM